MGVYGVLSEPLALPDRLAIPYDVVPGVVDAALWLCPAKDLPLMRPWPRVGDVRESGSAAASHDKLAAAVPLRRTTVLELEAIHWMKPL